MAIAAWTAPPRLSGRPRAPRRRAAFALATACTGLSIAFAAAAVLMTARGEPAAAALALLGCVVADGIDGPLARRLSVSTRFGAWLDALADMLAFGVAAPLLFGAWLRDAVPGPLLLAVMALLAVCAAVRLARFMLRTRRDRWFTGAPTTAAGMVVALSVLADAQPPAAAVLLGTVLSALMVSGFPYPKLAVLADTRHWAWAVPAVAIGVDPVLALLTIGWAYLACGPILWWRRHRGGPGPTAA